jgi:xanthine dehydrogenase large subunit
MKRDPLPAAASPFAAGAAAAHESAPLHVAGAAPYTDDLPELPGTLHAALGLSAVAHAALNGLVLDGVQRHPGVQRVLTAADIPGRNRIGIIVPDEPLLADGTIAHWGQPLFAVLATSRAQARAAARRASVLYEAHPAAVRAREAHAQGFEVAPPRLCETGDTKAALPAAALQLAGSVQTGAQEHFYLEGQVAYALPAEGGGLVVHVSTQHPSGMQQVIADVLGWPQARITVLCRRMGGAFGGKESQSAAVACIAALGAALTRRPVKLRLDRDDDFVVTGKRHAFDIRWRTGADQTGRLQALEIEHLLQCGHSLDYSGAVADRALFHATNAYHVPHVRLASHRARTNTQSATAFRGFGGPQAVLGMETAIEAVALALGVDALDVRRRNLFDRGERALTHYGFRLEDNVLPELVDQLEASSDYRARRRAVQAFNASQPVLQRGLALMPCAFGVGFGAPFLNQGGALVQIHTDGSVVVNHGGTEMGQGLNTKVAQIVAGELGLPAERVFCSATDTSKVPNTVSTAASSATDLNGMAALDAARTLKARLATVDGGRGLPFDTLCAEAFVAQVSLSATGYHRVPKVGYDFATLHGRPFLYYTYGAACSEVTIDTLSGELRVERVDILQDAGRSINPALDRGQVEGGFVQGMGWLTSEEIVWRDDGFLATHGPQTYKVPTANDVPRDFRVAFFDNANTEETVHRSKAIGEPPLKLAVSVWLAVLDAVASAGGRRRMPVLRAPATPEAVLAALHSVR